MNQTDQAFLKARKYQLEQNLANSQKFLHFFESRLPEGYNKPNSTVVKTDLQRQFAESAYSHKQLIAMLETYHHEVMNALVACDKARK